MLSLKGYITLAHIWLTCAMYEVIKWHVMICEDLGILLDAWEVATFTA